MTDKYFLGIDTSNYKTSVALVTDKGNIIKNTQKYLYVKKGERGLRQSAALFQHVSNLPSLINEVLDDSIERNLIESVSVSTKPRPVEGSYMPVFTAGYMAASSIASGLNIPLYEFSHQEGHIEAIKHYSPLKSTDKPFVSFHFSGGTTEAVLVDDSNFKIVGGTKDIAFGQVLDRIGVALGMEFPCGEELDLIACNALEVDHNLLPPIKTIDGYINLSGIETKCQRILDNVHCSIIVESLFYRLTRCISDMMNYLNKEYKIKDFIFAGGVSSSKYFRNNIKNHIDFNANIFYGDPSLSTDNAVGIALLGGLKHGD